MGRRSRQRRQKHSSARMPNVPCVRSRLHVLDVNVLRKTDIMQEEFKAASKSDHVLAIPTSVFSETIRDTSAWPHALHSNLSILSSMPERVVVLRNFPELVEREQREGRACDDFVCPQFTMALRQILTRIQGGAAEIRKFIKEDLASEIEDTKQVFYRHDWNKGAVVDGLKAFVDHLKPTSIKRLRNKDFDHLERIACEYLIVTQGNPLLRKWRDVGRVIEFLKSSVGSRISLYGAVQSMYEIAYGGIETKPAECVTNDSVMDGWYIMFGSLCRRVVSCDKRVNEMAQLLRGSTTWIDSAIRDPDLVELL